MTQLTLKLIAMLAMVLDHTAKVVVAHPYFLRYCLPSVDYGTKVDIYYLFVILGRLALPIFAWFAAEGCSRTRSAGKYALRLFAFAIISEIPFQLCFLGAANSGVKPEFHNVMWTLFLAVSGIYLGNLAEKHNLSWLKPVVYLAAIVLGVLLETDYNGWGVALVIGLYLLRNKREKLTFLTAWIFVFYLFWHGMDNGSLVWLTEQGRIQLYYCLGALFSVPLLGRYSGEKGRGAKWLFYLFYPAHLSLLYFVTTRFY